MLCQVPGEQRHLRPCPAALRGELGLQVVFVVPLGRVRFRHRCRGGAGISIEKAALHTGDDSRGVVVSELEPIRRAGRILAGPPAEVKRFEKRVLGRNVLLGANQTGVRGAAELAPDDQARLLLEVDGSRTVLSSNRFHVLSHCRSGQLAPPTGQIPRRPRRCSAEFLPLTSSSIIADKTRGEPSTSGSAFGVPSAWLHSFNDRRKI